MVTGTATCPRKACPVDNDSPGDNSHRAASTGRNSAGDGRAGGAGATRRTGIRTRRGGAGTAVRLRGLAGGRGAAAAVGAVETAALEHDADRVEELAQLARALRADAQRLIGEGLNDVEAVVTLGA